MTLQQMIEYGLSIGLEAVEVYESEEQSNIIKVAEGALEAYDSKTLVERTVRGLKDGKMASVTIENYDDDAIKNAIDTLYQNLCMLDSLEPEFMYEKGSVYPKTKSVTSDYANHSTSEKVEMLKNIEKTILSKDERIVKVGYCQYMENATKVRIVNSKGLDLAKDAAYVMTFIGAVAADDNQTAVGMAMDVNYNFGDLETERLIEESSSEALTKLGAGSVTSGAYPVVLNRDVASDILSAFQSVFSGEAAIRKLTILADKVGTKCFGENITIVDDPLSSKALIQEAFDDEGVPSQTKNVVENGVFKGFLHNLKTANALGAMPTGNGKKTSSGITPAPTNMYIKEGTLSKDEIIETVSYGIYITEVNGLHAGLNPISGDFNVQSSGFMIRDGKIAEPVTLFVTSGNFYEMMNNVELIGNDIKERFHDVVSPTLKIKNLMISGK